MIASDRDRPMTAFADHFSGHARLYAASRPTYPEALFDWLAGVAPARERAWDCACGNGQATGGLAARFRSVVATDASVAQLALAVAPPNVGWAAGTGEAAPLAAASCDLLLVAQALHWLDAERLWDQARRVLRPGGIVAASGYQLLEVAPAFDAVIRRYYHRVVGPYWPPERAVLESGFATVPFPFDELDPPPFEMTARWPLARVLAYLGSWSASRRASQALGRDPLDEVRGELEEAWGDPGRDREVRWPLALRAGRLQGPSLSLCTTSGGIR
jgi:SAM-dependent methyltransferase